MNTTQRPSPVPDGPAAILSVWSRRTSSSALLTRTLGFLMMGYAMACASAAVHAVIPPTREQFLHFALLREGDARRGQQLFASDERLGCVRCHTVDGTASRAAPDLFAVGDKYGRRDLIESVLHPSASIAVGYSATTIETKAGDEFTGIIKEATASEIGLMGADAKLVRIRTGDIAERRTSDISFMPEGLQDALSLQEFTDLIDYLVSLKAPAQSGLAEHGMPDRIPLSSRQVAFRPVNLPEQHFEHPVWAGMVPGESKVLLVAEHESGKIWRLAGDPSRKSLFLDAGKHDPGARGVLELAFHPRFRENRRYFIARQVLENGEFDSVLEEREASSDFMVDSGRPARRVLRLKAATNINHAGAAIFGPDGYLYMGMGDSGPPEDPQGHGQDPQVLLGKILRIDVDHPAAGSAYGIPSDNPFRDRPGFRPEIWALGLREPWRLSFDAETGDLWVGDVGQDRYEEVDLVRKGENYGWNVYEGFEPFSNRYRKDGAEYVAPVFAYRRPYGPCVTGGFVYRGDPHSAFYGVYIFGDYQSRRIFGLTQENRRLKAIRQIGMAPERIASFAQGPAGELYVVGYEGTLFELDLNDASFE